MGRGTLVGLAVLGLAASGAEAKPNLKTTKVANPPRTAAIGGSFQVKDTASNKGSRAGKSETRFYLSADKKRGLDDLLLTGARKVPSLGRGARSAAPKRPKVMVTVPVGTPTDKFFLLACADDREKIRESKEGDNCRAAKRKTRVTVPLKAPVFRFDAFADVTPLIDVDQDEQQIVAQKAFRCAARPKARVASLDKALDNIKGFLETTAGKDAYAAFKSSKEYKSAAGAEDAAAAAFLLERPGAALAAMVRAHELEPKEASHLVNAAGLASSIGLPNEALTLLDAAEHLDDPDRPGMGISRQAVALTNRAHALVSIGDHAKATQLADSALAIEPLMAEAEQIAGRAQLCAGNTKTAVARIRKGRKRQPGKEPPLDDSGGKESEMRKLPLPPTPSQAVELVDFYRSQQQDFISEMQARNEKQIAAQQRVNARQTDPGRNLNQKLLFAVTMTGTDPKLAALWKEVSDLRDKSLSWYREKWCDGDSCDDEEWQRIVTECDGDKACINERCVPATKNWHQGWLNDQTALYEKAKEYVRAMSKRKSALAAHIADPDTYALAMLSIESEELSTYMAIQQPAFYWSDWVRRAKDDCVDVYEPPPSTDGTGPAEAQGSGPCDQPELKSFSASLDLKIFDVKVKCSEISFSIESPGWIGGFAEVTYDFKTGQTTLFAGAQAKIDLGDAKADFKSGIYVTGTASGLDDMGWRVGGSSTLGGGLVQYDGPSDYVDISFVAGLIGA